MTENELSRRMFDLGLKVHRELRPGLLEGVYEECLFYEIVNAGLFAERQKPIPVIYEHIKMDTGFRADIVVENKLVLELKSIDSLNDIHLAIMLTYLRFTGCKLGMLMNFNSVLFKNGVRRVIKGELVETTLSVHENIRIDYE
jgi:GxxExxY protein